MPITLPSGIELGLYIGHILEPDRNWFKAPEGHFWYGVPDLEANQPPFGPDDEWLQKYETAPVPKSRVEAEQYARVCIATADGMMFWRGETLSEFPKYGPLGKEDMKAWLEWLATDTVQNFLDKAIVRAATQAEINKEARDFVVFRVQREEGDWLIGQKIIDNPTREPN